MISIKKFLDSKDAEIAVKTDDLLSVAVDGYRTALMQMARSCQSACPGVGAEFNDRLLALARDLSSTMNCLQMSASGQSAHEQLEQWALETARHYQQKSDEVKDLLLAMMGTAEGVSARDQRAAEQIHEVTKQLKAVASLDDLTQIRASIENSAILLKSSIDRMTEEGKAAVSQLRTQASSYQTKLEEAEKLALRDGLTGLLNRLCVEKQIERRIASSSDFSVAVIDINRFKQVNDRYGHLAGDELLKQFSGELVSASRSTDIVGRWGGDEFVLLFDGDLETAATQVERLEKWVCGNYSLETPTGTVALEVQASFGLADHAEGEEMKHLLARADKAMYNKKPTDKER